MDKDSYEALSQEDSSVSSSGASLPEALNRALQEAGLTPTPMALQLLMAAAQLGNFKEADLHVLSASGLLFAAVELPIEDVPIDRKNPEVEAILFIQTAFLGSNRERRPRFDDLITSDFYREKPSKWRSAAPYKKTEFSSRMLTGIQRLRGRRRLDVVDLIQCALDSPGEFLHRRLQALELQAEQLRSEVTELKYIAFRAHYRRERGGPLALGASQYALALARLFRVADDEFTLALLAPWGMGKTTIAREIERYLTKPHDYHTDLENAFGPGLHSSKDTAAYETVRFSAWTYRRQPELWVWLYESFVRTFLGRSAIVSALRIFRCGIAKHGLLPLAKSLGVMALLAVPAGWIAAALKGGLALFGAAGLLAIVLLCRRWFASVRILMDRYGIVASHRERLGLQALIGDDLRALVDAWVRGGGPNIREKLQFVFFAVAVAGGWAFLNMHMAAPPSAWMNMICGWNADLCSDAEQSLPIAWLGWTVWVVISAAVCISLFTEWGRADRVLLIVDDLDRCPPDEIVDLIDSVKLMLEEPKVGQRVQALILADNRVLEHAITKRFKELIGFNLEDPESRRRRIIREHMEKVFLCHFHLRPLSAQDVSELADTFAEEFQQAEVPEQAKQNVRTQRTSFRHATSRSPPREEPASSAVSEPGRLQRDVSSPTSQSELSVSLTFSISEKKAIADVVKSNFGQKSGEEAPTPRFVRSFLFKYQLARMILQLGGRSYSPRAIAEALATMMKTSDLAEKAVRPEGELIFVARQVV